MPIAEYTHEHFQSLPTIGQAGAQFVSIGGPNLVHGLFRKFFLEHGMDSTFGLCLMHRHADLEESEKLVHYRETASPWNDLTDLPIKPVMWSMSVDGSMRPTEFQYSSRTGDLLDEKKVTFMEEFSNLVKENNISVFGLVEYPGDDFETTCEITQGRTNINLLHADVHSTLFHQASGLFSDSIQLPEQTPIIDTAWFFSPKLYQRGCKCACKQTRDGGHDHDYHYTTLRDE